MSKIGSSWGQTFSYEHQLCFPHWQDEIKNNLQKTRQESILGYGLGRSYGDSCLNHKGQLLCTQNLNRILAFDPQTGVLCCESGISLGSILEFCVPKGFFLPVTPGTKFVSLGGAIANDVHGKNHHIKGNFGSHVRSFELFRSDGQSYRCSPQQNQDLFKATIGGLGLTGMISWAEIKLIPIQSPFLQVETVKFRNLEEFFTLNEQAEKRFEYVVSWMDCMAKGKSLGRGHMIQGNFISSPKEENQLDKIHSPKGLKVPFYFPNIALNKLSISLFNKLYYHKQVRRIQQQKVHYDPFFYPLDGLHQWNRMYGRRGFYQYQCVVDEGQKDALFDLFRVISKNGLSSFLSVLKKFSPIHSPGMLSFPRPGYTLAADFPNNGPATQKLFCEMDHIVEKVGGRIYPAKDALMSASFFQKSYPNWQDFKEFIDPQFSSNFWRRVSKKVGEKP